MENKKIEDKFMQGIVALMVSQFMIKILGVIYTIYLTNRKGFGDVGNAIYMSGYQIYTLLLAISSIGIPNAISKLVSEKIVLRDYKGADRVFKISLVLFGTIGFICTSLLFCGANFISNKLIQIPESENTLKALSPAIFFVSISSVIRGYFNGKKEINITAKSQTIEQLFKSILTIIFVEIIAFFSNTNTKLMAAVANLATTMATICSFIYIFMKIQKSRKKEIYWVNRKYFVKERISSIIKKIFSVSIPMSISSLLSTINKNIDSITIVRLLKGILGEENAKIRYGILSSKVDLLLSMPQAFNLAFATALVPEIASSLVKNDLKNINKRLKFSMLLTILIGLPCTFGIFVYSEEILKLLFPKASNGAISLRIGAITIIFGVLIQTINGALQGLGKNQVPVKAMFYGMITKIICNNLLIPIENLYENGAVIGTIMCNIVSFYIVYRELRNTIKLEFKMYKILFKPIVISILMIFVSYNIFLFLTNLNVFEYISIISGIISAIIVYIILIFIFKVFSKEEIKMLPYGEKIYIFLKKIKIY